MTDPARPMPYWQIMRRGTFSFYWFPRVYPGVYREYYNGWMLAINLVIFSLEWIEA